MNGSLNSFREGGSASEPDPVLHFKERKFMRHGLIILFLFWIYGCGAGQPQSDQWVSKKLDIAGISIGHHIEEVLSIHDKVDCYEDQLSDDPGDKSCVGDFRLETGDTIYLTIAIHDDLIEGAYNRDWGQESVHAARKYLSSKYGPATSSNGNEEIWEDGQSIITLDMEGGIVFHRIQLPAARENTVETQISSQSANKNCADSPITVKGLCIGMPMQAAVDNVNKLLGIDLEIENLKRAAHQSDISPVDAPESVARTNLTRGRYPLLGLEVVLVGSYGKLTQFAFKDAAVAKLFNANDMGLMDFAQTFVDAYSIPQMDLSMREINYMGTWRIEATWSYRYDYSGILVEVSGVEDVRAKGIMVKAVTPAKDRTFD